MRVCQIEDDEDRIVRRLILPFDNRIFKAHFLNGTVILKNNFTIKANPGISRTGYAELNIGIHQHILIDFLRVVRAEPQLAVFFTGKHERTALRLAIAANRRQILNRIFV